MGKEMERSRDGKRMVGGNGKEGERKKRWKGT